MKKLVFAGMLTLCLAGSSAMAQTVRWRGVVGVIATQTDTNPIANGLDSGTFAWSARSGTAVVNLDNGAAAFQVQGLVINGTQFSGTPGPVSQVEGTVVCNPGDADQSTHDTAPVTLSSHGDAFFTGRISGIPAVCDNPLFLVRIVSPGGALGRWIATGTEPGTVQGMNRHGREDD